MSANNRGKRRTLQGVVVSDKMDKTVVVMIQRLTPHPLYGRVMRRTKKYKAHDENNECRQGDIVPFGRRSECRYLRAPT